MRAVVVANPRSGRGKGLALADAAAAVLGRAGVRVDRLAVGPGLPPLDPPTVAGADVVAVAGGDGTVLNVAPVCIDAGVPIYHLAAGNENLFAREFGMNRDPARLLAAMQRGQVTRCDVARCTPCGHAWEPIAPPFPFLLMASIGPDAAVVHRLHASRTKAIGHRAYALPVLGELINPSIPRLKVWADGGLVVDGRGSLIVANSRCYALGVNPCPGALIDDGLLDFAFLPADTAVDALVGLARCRLRWDSADTARGTGTKVRLEAIGPAQLQIDGEAAGPCHVEPGRLRLEVAVDRHALRVLNAR